MSTDTRAKIFVRLEPDRAQAFKDAIRERGGTMTAQDVLEQLVEAYIAHETEASIRHLDGSLCPLSAMIISLSDAVAKMVATRPFIAQRTQPPKT